MTDIQNNAPSNKYFHQMLNMADDDLNPYEYRLLGHYIRVCGGSGKCWEAAKTTASICQMSKPKMLKTRKALEDRGYIRVETSGGGRKRTTRITIVDRMMDNIQRYTSEAPPKTVNDIDSSTGNGKGDLQFTPETVNDIDSLAPKTVNDVATKKKKDFKKNQQDEEEPLLPGGKTEGTSTPDPVPDDDPLPEQPVVTTPLQETPDDSPNPVPEPDPETPSPRNPSALQLVVAHVWDLPPGGRVNTLITQLVGNAKKGKRKEWAIEEPMTTVEVLAFGMWWRNLYPHLLPPSNAETLHERVTEFRDYLHHRGEAYLDRARQQLPMITGSSLDESPPETVPPLEPEETEERGEDPEIDAWIAELSEFVDQG